jgi:hypothetical protein
VALLWAAWGERAPTHRLVTVTLHGMRGLDAGGGLINANIAMVSGAVMAAAQAEDGEMTRRPRTLDFFEADDGRVWTIRDHSRLKRQWRFVRKLPDVVQFILLLFALTWFVLVASVSWLVTGALTMR